MDHAHVTRRDFGRRVLTCGAATVATGAWASSGRAATAKFPPGRYVDVHTHLGTVWNTGPELTADALLRWMDAADIAQAVVLPLVSPE